MFFRRGIHIAGSGDYYVPPHVKRGTPLINFVAIFLASAGSYILNRDYRGVTKREEEMRIKREQCAEDLKKKREQYAEDLKKQRCNIKEEELDAR